MIGSASEGVLLDHAQDKIAVLDEGGRFTYVNDAARRILGLEPRALIGEDAFARVHPEDVDDVRAAFKRTINREDFETNTVEYRYRAADGAWVWLESRMSNLTDNELDGYVVSSRDVTDRVAAQRDRQQTSDRLRELSTTTGEVLWMFDADWSELLFVNPAYATVYGQSVERLEADPSVFLEAIHPEDVPVVEQAMAAASAGRSVDLEYRVNPDRDYRVWVWVQAEPIVEDGEVVRITGFSRDITDRYRRERQLYVMDNLLRHNVRNDLNVILGNAELIDETTAEVADLTAVIRRTGEGLLATAEKEREIIELLTDRALPRQLDLAATARDAVRRIRDRYPDARIDTRLPSDPVFVRALDEVSLAVLELLENAIAHHTGDQPRVRVSVRRVDERVVLTVADDGPVIPEVEAHVLTGHHEMNDLYHSTGLGLWLVYWIAELSDGRVEVDSDDGNRIRLELPAG